jgi:endonuclease/exonuclease/phosphatase family metal-dependent hydrolase
VGNLHAQVHSVSRAEADIDRAARAVLGWAGDAPVVLGGDFNIPRPVVGGMAEAAGHGVDRVLVRGLEAAGPGTVLEHGALSDHAPVLVALRPCAARMVGGR